MDWLRRNFAHLNVDFGALPSILFMHIPLPGMVGMEKGKYAEECFGEKNEEFAPLADDGNVCV